MLRSNKIIINIFTLLCSLLVSLNLSAQTDTLITKRPVNIWIYLTDGILIKGIFAGRTQNNILLYRNASRKQIARGGAALEGIPYQNISLVKTKKSNGILGGVAKGALIGILPLVGGEGGAYATVITLPLGIITGAIIGKTSKKKHAIDNDQQKFLDFTNKYLK